MTKRQVRFGSGDRDKARLATISMQQVDEIRAITGENLNEVIQAAITERYMRIVYHEQEQRITELEAHVAKLESIRPEWSE